MLKLKQRGDAGPCDVFIIFPKAHHPFLHSTQSPETKSFMCFPGSLGRTFRSTDGPAIVMVTNVVTGGNTETSRRSIQKTQLTPRIPHVKLWFVIKNKSFVPGWQVWGPVLAAVFTKNYIFQFEVTVFLIRFDLRPLLDVDWQWLAIQERTETNLSINIHEAKWGGMEVSKARRLLLHIMQQDILAQIHSQDQTLERKHGIWQRWDKKQPRGLKWQCSHRASV